MTMDLSRKLEIKTPHGVANLSVLNESERVVGYSFGSCTHEWSIDSNGNDIDGIMPRVHNTKRKPKNGEWWVCKDINGMERVLYYNGYMYYVDGPKLSEAYLEVTPLYPLIKDPDF